MNSHEVPDSNGEKGQQSAPNLVSRRNFLKGVGITAAGLAGMATVGCGEADANDIIPRATVPGLASDSGKIDPENAISSPSPTSTVEATPTPEVKKEPTTLRGWADKAGIEIGASLSHKEAVGMFPLIASEFNSATVSYDLAWINMEDVRGSVQFANSPKFADSEARVKFGVDNRMKVNGQSLIFTSQYPEWVRNGNLSVQEATELVKKRVQDVAGHFKGKVDRWVVVNEFHPLSWGRADALQKVLGSQLLDIAFQAARDAVPDSELIYNDNENQSSTSLGTANAKTIVNRLKAKGLIDGIGIQMHLDGSKPIERDDLIATMRAYGVPVHITEMDVNIKDVQGTQDERFAKQAEVYRTVMQAALDSGVCKGVSFYTVGDKYSWIETDKAYKQSSAIADPTPFDDALKPKPAYFAIRDVLKSAAA